MKRYKLLRTRTEDLIIGKLYIMSLKTGILISKHDHYLKFMAQSNPDEIWDVPIMNLQNSILVHYVECKSFKFGK